VSAAVTDSVVQGWEASLGSPSSDSAAVIHSFCPQHWAPSLPLATDSYALDSPILLGSH